MTADVDNLIDNCDRCLRSKSSTRQKSPLTSIKTTYPLEMACKFRTNQWRNYQLSSHHGLFTRFAVAIPTKDQTAKTTAEAFSTNLFSCSVIFAC